ncbi:unnamed protein product [Paramecium sonneborni]|uniref:Uncharacterized protein n=1 Tax=Paramecium sonneborni TaxID=65129 RepID=A0A8S1NN70_9CILI|nr:unnamed protein product [Paramecium sonneborni]
MNQIKFGWKAEYLKMLCLFQFNQFYIEKQHILHMLQLQLFFKIMNNKLKEKVYVQFHYLQLSILLLVQNHTLKYLLGFGQTTFLFNYDVLADFCSNYTIMPNPKFKDPKCLN